MIISLATADDSDGRLDRHDNVSGQRSSIMTMLTHTGGSFRPSSIPSAERHTGATHAVGDRLSRIRQVCWFVLNVLLASGVLAGLIALKTAAFVWRLHA
jgi:hypothetical protein